MRRERQLRVLPFSRRDSGKGWGRSCLNQPQKAAGLKPRAGKYELKIFCAQRVRHHFAQHLPEVGGKRQVAAFVELLVVGPGQRP